MGWQGSFIQPKETVASEAAFGQATWNVDDSLHLTGGARYTYDHRNNVGGNGYTWDYDATVPQVPLSPAIDPTRPGQGYNPSVPPNDGVYNGSKATWLGRVSYDMDRQNHGLRQRVDRLQVGRPAGWRPALRRRNADQLRDRLQEHLPRRRRASGTTRLYYEKFKDFQFSAPVTNPDGSRTLATSNAEGAKVYGFESELAAKLTAGRPRAGHRRLDPRQAGPADRRQQRLRAARLHRARHQHLPGRDGQHHAALADRSRCSCSTSTPSTWPTAPA